MKRYFTDKLLPEYGPWNSLEVVRAEDADREVESWKNAIASVSHDYYAEMDRREKAEAENERWKKLARAMEETVDNVRAALGLESTHYLIIADQVEEKVAELAATKEREARLLKAVDWWGRKTRRLREKIDCMHKNQLAMEKKYNDLVMEVRNKIPGETRHETARRIIRERDFHLAEQAEARKREARLREALEELRVQVLNNEPRPCWPHKMYIALNAADRALSCKEE